MGEYSQGSNMNKLSEEELEKAANEELGEDKQRLKSDIEALKEWISKTPHLKGIRQGDAQLLKFLRGCKFSLERTKEKLDLYNTCRANVPNWFSCWDVESTLFQKFLGWGKFRTPRNLSEEGFQLILMRPGKLDPTQPNILEESFITSLA